MKRNPWALMVVVAMSASIAHAGTITQTINYDFTFQEAPAMTIAGFDDQGGTLQLDRLVFDWDLNFDVEYRLENTGPTALAAGDFAMSMEYYTVHQLGIGEGFPAYGPGGTFFNIEQVALGAYDPTPGGSDTYTSSYSENYQRTLEFTRADDPTYLAAMTQSGNIDTVYGGFGGVSFAWINEPIGWDPGSGPFGQPIYPIDDAVWIFMEETSHFGSVTVTYDYSVVPEPATMSLLGILGLVIVRRRGVR